MPFVSCHCLIMPYLSWITCSVTLWALSSKGHLDFTFLLNSCGPIMVDSLLPLHGCSSVVALALRLFAVQYHMLLLHNCRETAGWPCMAHACNCRVPPSHVGQDLYCAFCTRWSVSIWLQQS